MAEGKGRGIINLRLDGARTRKDRAIVPINRGLMAALQTAKDAALSDHAIEWGGNRVASIRKSFEGAMRRSGVKDVARHAIRHSAAVAMVSNEIPITQVAQHLGNSNTAITYSTYGRFAPDHLTEAAEVLDFVRLRAKK